MDDPPKVDPSVAAQIGGPVLVHVTGSGGICVRKGRVYEIRWYRGIFRPLHYVKGVIFCEM